ncbi:MAG: Nramp family divalent metal transporter [Ignavibacteria bacterium]|nr:Nramp family divalent metal transporter [Ignavibacteria bacterium]
MNPGKISYNGIIKALGPGILYAGAAIGASHLVQSTRAGASYGFEIIWAVILINLFKYPFFEFAYRYTAATGKSMLEGYRNLGKWAIVIFFILNFFTGIVNFSAVVIVSSGLAAFFFNINVDMIYISIVLLAVVLLLLLIGHYALLDKTMKLIILALSIATITAFLISVSGGTEISEGFVSPDLWDATGIAFLIALMGWMPTPIEASVWPSLWALERSKQTHYKPTYKESLFDFHTGYIGSAIMALFFLGLGALVLFGTNIEFSNSSIKFSEQLVMVYSQTFGEWSIPIISAVALLTMFSTTLTVIDAYPRALGGSMEQISATLKKYSSKLYWIWVLFLSAAAVLIIGVFTSSMKSLLDFATVISFLAAPFFAYINFRVVKSDFLPMEYHPKKWLTILSWAGLIFLLGFGVLFVVSKIIL